MKISNVISITLGLCLVAGFIFYSCGRKEVMPYCHEGELTDDDNFWFHGFDGNVYQVNSGGYDTGSVYKDDSYGTWLSTEGHCRNPHITTERRKEISLHHSVNACLSVSHGSNPWLSIGYGINLSQVSTSDSMNCVSWPITNANLYGSNYIFTKDSTKISNNVPWKVVFVKGNGIVQMFFKGNVVLTKL
jgi:hypothetical protein